MIVYFVNKNKVMRNIFLIMIAAVVFNGVVFSQDNKKGRIDLINVPVSHNHYQPEYTFDMPVDTEIWEKQEPGIQVSFGSTNKLYLRREVPIAGEKMMTWKETGWRGEKLNAQILVWAIDTIQQVRFKVSDLKSSEGFIISNKNIKLNMVRYVVSDHSYNTNSASCGISPREFGWLMPDRFESFDRFDLPAQSVRPVWISYEIPSDAPKGDYTGYIEVNSTNGKAELKVKITVQEHTIPKPSEWKHRLDLWQNPFVISKYFNVEPWSIEHKVLLKNHLKIYAEAGGKYISTYAVHSPWSDDSYILEELMIDWIKKSNGKWQFDYSDFDTYVQLAMKAGINKAITIYTPLPWKNRFRYMDEKTGSFIVETWPPSSQIFQSVWNVFLDDLKIHLLEKGWFDMTYLGINENPLEDTFLAIDLIKKHSKDWKIYYAGNWHPELSPFIDEYSVVIGREPTEKELQKRNEMGFTTSCYVCCTPARPNNFVFSPPVEGRYIGWYSAAVGYNGFLRWAYDAWPYDPQRDARHTLWPAGDSFMVYPGGNSCIRFEKLREGIVDFEKIQILREKSSKSRNKNAKRIMKELEDHLLTFIMNPDYSKRNYNLADMTMGLQKGKILINRLSTSLNQE